MKKEKLIKKTTEELLKKMSFDEVSVEIKKQENSPILIVSIQIENDSQLIGQSGSNLNDFQRVLRLLIAKKDSEAPFFLVDINGYREERKIFLQDLSQEIAEQVSESKKSVMLQPMSSYERRIIHLELAEKPDIVTESIGEEPERRVVIRPYP